MPPVNILENLYTYIRTVMQGLVNLWPSKHWPEVRDEAKKGKKRPCEPRGENRRRDRKVLAARFLWRVPVPWRGAHAGAGKQRDQGQQRRQWLHYSPSPSATQSGGKRVRRKRVKLRLEKKRGAKVRGKAFYVDKFNFFATPTSILIGNKINLFPQVKYTFPMRWVANDFSVFILTHNHFPLIFLPEGLGYLAAGQSQPPRC